MEIFIILCRAQALIASDVEQKQYLHAMNTNYISYMVTTDVIIKMWRCNNKNKLFV